MLLECMSNLMANEMFSPDPPEERKEAGKKPGAVFSPDRSIVLKCRHLVIVTGKYFLTALPTKKAPWIISASWEG